METYMQVEILDNIQEKDKKFFEEKEKKFGAATFCAECGMNTATGRYPFWHRYARTLCSRCGEKYRVLLKEIGAYDFF